MTVEASGPNTELAKQENDKAYTLIQASKFTEAEPILRRSVQADSSYGPAHNNLGIVLLKQSRYYDAAWELEAAGKMMPYAAEPKNNLGLVYQQAGKQNAAVIAFQKAHELQPNNPEYLSNLALARVIRGDHDEQLRTQLREVIFRDARLPWQDWARRQMYRIIPDTQPTTRPVTVLPTSRPAK